LHPRGLASLKDDTLAVADTGGGRVVFLDPGEYSATDGDTAGARQFGEPTDDNGYEWHLLRAEAFNQRLQHIGETEEPGRADPPLLHGPPGGADNGVGSRAALCADPDGQLLNEWNTGRIPHSAVGGNRM
jgi:hypothetical protein